MYFIKFKKKFSLARILLFALVAIPFNFCFGQKAAVFKPSLGDGADPWIIKFNNIYYMCASVNESDESYITVSKSTKLTQTGAPQIVWLAPRNGFNSTNIWAPELHHIKGKWYIYYAAGKSGPPYISQRSGVLESVTDDPQSSYTDKGIINTGLDSNDTSGTIWAIDLTVAEIKNKLYAVWSGWEKNEATDKTQQNLYIAKMDNPWTIKSKRVKLSSPTENWETGGSLNLEEGPEFLQHDSNVFIIYSTRESWTSEYRLGQLKLKNIAKSILDPENWTKSGPVFTGKDAVYGVGHASFTTSPNGKEWWIIYHTKKEVSPGWQREIHLQPFAWNELDNPVFGSPVQPGQLIALPQGENQ